MGTKSPTEIETKFRKLVSNPELLQDRYKDVLPILEDRRIHLKWSEIELEELMELVREHGYRPKLIAQ